MQHSIGEYLLFLRDYLRVPVWGVVQGSALHLYRRIGIFCNFFIAPGLAHDAVLVDVSMSSAFDTTSVRGAPRPEMVKAETIRTGKQEISVLH